MNEALITGAVAIIVCLINNVVQQIISDRKRDSTVQLISYKLEELTKKVNLHNNAVERLYKLEKAVEVDDEKFSEINHRIEFLMQDFEKAN